MNDQHIHRTTKRKPMDLYVEELAFLQPLPQQHYDMYINPDLLLIDEMGHDRLELEETREAYRLFKIIDERCNKSKPLMMTTNADEHG